jgi:beta-glucosidase
MSDVTQPHSIVDARDPASISTLFDGAVEGHVLVKNINNFLPLKSNLSLISVFGYDAAPVRTNNPDGSADWAIGLEPLATTANWQQFPLTAQAGTMIA